MTDFEDELESLDEQIEEGDEDSRTPADDSFDDLESDQWSERFGESYIEDPYDVDELDDQDLERMEEEFFEGGSGPRSRYGRLDELDDE